MRPQYARLAFVAAFKCPTAFPSGERCGQLQAGQEVTSRSRRGHESVDFSYRETEGPGPPVTWGGGVCLSLENLVVLALIAAVCGFVAERMVHGRLPFGLVGGIFTALLGAWLLVEMLRWRIPGDMTAGGVPVLTAVLGAAAVIFVSTVLSRPRLRRRRG
jgi:uncharacterized membrane protein YeaQ/YmgE (transglycosylase-associated protein family)